MAAQLRVGFRWVLLISTCLVASSCGGDEPARLTEPVVGGDLVLVMQPGDGTTSNTGRYFVEIFDWEGTFGLREGTANHIGWIGREYGPLHVVTFTAGRDNPRGGEPEFCWITFPGGGGCGLDPGKPVILGWGDYGSGFGADIFGGPESAEAVITTESDKTVAVLTVEGYGHAEWPREWGKPQAVDFYDIAGDLLATLAFQLEPEG